MSAEETLKTREIFQQTGEVLIRYFLTLALPKSIVKRVAIRTNTRKAHEKSNIKLFIIIYYFPLRQTPRSEDYRSGRSRCYNEISDLNFFTSFCIQVLIDPLQFIHSSL